MTKIRVEQIKKTKSSSPASQFIHPLILPSFLPLAPIAPQWSKIVQSWRSKNSKKKNLEKNF
jgi:hypothetical protein